MTADVRYRRLPGRSVFFNPLRSSLWAADDHLLLVSHSPATQTYTRFAYSDIQAVVSTRSRRKRVYAIIFGSLAAIQLLLLPLAALVGVVLTTVLSVPLAVYLLALLINALGGPTCSTQLRTSVQTVELPSLNREATVRRALARIRSSIVAAQGELANDDLTGFPKTETPYASGEQAHAVLTSVPRSGTREAAPAEPQIHHCHGTAHLAVFGASVAAAFWTLSGLMPGVGFTHIALLAFLELAIMGVGLIALVAQWRSDMPTGLKAATWSAVAWQFIALPVTFVWGIVLGVTQGAARQSAAAPIGLTLAFTAFFLCGGMGLFLLGRFRMASRPSLAAEDESSP